MKESDIDHSRADQAFLSPLPGQSTGELVIRARSGDETSIDTLLPLRPRGRQLIVARTGLQCSFAVLAQRLSLPSAAAARTAVKRATRRLRQLIDEFPY
jgi:DNA-directed RNA polymerase specialized sigma24 family protein